MTRKYEFVAVDFDGTLCKDAFPEIGEPQAAVIEYVKQLAAEGSKIILHTAREDGNRPLLSEAVVFCGRQGIPLYAVNENPGNPYPAQYGTPAGRKVYADLYIDDKALNPADIHKKAERDRVLQMVRSLLQDILSILTAGDHAVRAYILTAIRVLEGRGGNADD